MSEWQKDRASGILKISEEINHIKDIDLLLERVLQEARHATNADAGSIYLAERDKLRITYIQNDTLSKADPHNSLFYQNQLLDISPQSMAGYVAQSKQPLLIDDAYELTGPVPYRLNRHFDEAMNYRTQSMLTIPLISNNQKLIGVMQIINARDDHNRVIPFSERDQLYVTFFATYAAAAIEKAQMTREIILRMIRMAELRDPEETGAHVKRVGSYAVEIYQRWAVLSGIDENEIKRVRDILKIAAMLHDVGKVAISDTLLKKRGSLDTEEFRQMKLHTVFGARLFSDSTSDWDDMAREIALHHHEKWDGSGYPGIVPLDETSPDLLGSGLRGTDIPLAARIVALADVYDALVTPRCYKDCWPEEQVLTFISEQRGRHFDPHLVDAFLESYDVIRRLRDKYQESQP